MRSKFDVRTFTSDDNCVFRFKISLEFEFWTFGRLKSTTVAHFCIKMGLALEFWTAGRLK